MAEHTEPDPLAGPALTPVAVAYRALLDHATQCHRCVANWRECAARRALSETLRRVR
ncbi:hypothetical protein [Streptomyces sp. NPDC046939]|uniref:hypothetical protein n=1 Tax=Streptomyces sp. NPDC046939 TaxID=3155376 RepID=UPI0033F85ABA